MSGIGHLAPAFAAKSAARTVPLWVLLIASETNDILSILFSATGIERKAAIPANGTYSATKFALEALNDALRLELEPFGIQVVVIEPGGIKTHFDDTAQAHAKQILGNLDSPYQQIYKQSEIFFRRNAST